MSCAHAGCEGQCSLLHGSGVRHDNRSHAGVTLRTRPSAIAEAGTQLLHQFGIGLAFIATTRKGRRAAPASVLSVDRRRSSVRVHHRCFAQATRPDARRTLRAALVPACTERRRVLLRGVGARDRRRDGAACRCDEGQAQRARRRSVVRAAAGPRVAHDVGAPAPTEHIPGTYEVEARCLTRRTRSSSPAGWSRASASHRCRPAPASNRSIAGRSARGSRRTPTIRS